MRTWKDKHLKMGKDLFLNNIVFDQPLISIIVPIYRVELYLDKCIQSIIAQTYRNIEIILVDDGSDDHCPEICDQYAAYDNRIRVIHKKNGGLTSARMAGVQVASGEFIGYVDGDDWIEPEMYETMAVFAGQYGAKVVSVSVFDEWEGYRKERKPFFSEGFYEGTSFQEKIEPNLLYNWHFYEHGIEVHVWDKLFRADLVRIYQMREGLIDRLVDDTMVSIPAILDARSVYICHKCLYHYRARRNSLKREAIYEFKSIVKRWYPVWMKELTELSNNTNMEKQLQYYILYLLSMKTPAFFDAVSGKNLSLYGSIENNKRIVVYGAGAAGISLSAYIKTLKDIRLVGWLDQNWESMDPNDHICSPESVMDMDFDFILVAILKERVFLQVKEYLEKLGVSSDCIRWIDPGIMAAPQRYLNRLLSK